jgi:hypothetical protein
VDHNIFVSRDGLKKGGRGICVLYQVQRAYRNNAEGVKGGRGGTLPEVRFRQSKNRKA